MCEGMCVCVSVCVTVCVSNRLKPAPHLSVCVMTSVSSKRKGTAKLSLRGGVHITRVAWVGGGGECFRQLGLVEG